MTTPPLPTNRAPQQVILGADINEVAARVNANTAAIEQTVHLWWRQETGQWDPNPVTLPPEAYLVYHSEKDPAAPPPIPPAGNGYTAIWWAHRDAGL